MIFLVIILILMTVYVIQNKKLKDSTKTAWFISLIVFVLLMLLFGL